MKVKKYVVRDMQEAMYLIREELGPEAVILSSRRLPRKGLLDLFRPAQLEVTAALDEPAPGAVYPQPGGAAAAYAAGAALSPGRAAASPGARFVPPVVRTVLPTASLPPGAAAGEAGMPAGKAGDARLRGDGAPAGAERRRLVGGTPAAGGSAAAGAGEGGIGMPPVWDGVSGARPSGEDGDARLRGDGAPAGAGRPGACGEAVRTAGDGAPAEEDARLASSYGGSLAEAPAGDRAPEAGRTGHTAPVGPPAAGRAGRTPAAEPPAANRVGRAPAAGAVAHGRSGGAAAAGPPVPTAGVENSTAEDGISLPEQENSHPSFNIILKRQEELLVHGDPVNRWRKKLLEMEIRPETVALLLDGMEEPAAGEGEADELLRVRLKGRLAALVEPAYRQWGGLPGSLFSRPEAAAAGSTRPAAPDAGRGPGGTPEIRADGRGRQSTGSGGGHPSGGYRTPAGEGALTSLPAVPAGEVSPGGAARGFGPDEVGGADGLPGEAHTFPAVHPSASVAGRSAPAVCAFVGPTGVGKTTTLAKLATRLTVFEQRRIALVALYSHRFGLAEELQFYGNTLGVPVEVVMTPAELAAAVRGHGDKDAVLIDSEGISWRNAAQLLRLKGFLDALGEEREIFLVLSAATRTGDLLQTAAAFDRAGYTQLIFTKLDETAVHGPALDLVLHTGRPVACATGGQNVPDDLELLTPRRLAALLLEERD